jgi:DNA modification methylase
MCVNKLILGDNLEILKAMESDTVDLIYLDPPFFSNKTYEVIWGDEGEVRSFEDRFAGGIDHYISWLKIRVRQMHRVLKPTGSIFLHCDWHASAEIKVDILNKIFGRNNFRNEIVWCYHKWTNKSYSLQQNHDTIFWYSKSGNYTFHKLKNENAVAAHYEKGYHTNTVKGNISQLIVYDKEKAKKHIESGKYDKIVYREGVAEVVMPDWWEISIINSQAKERIGYPTQKPEILLQRIIELTTNEGDIVLDPFVGGGTAVAVAEQLNRKWIGIDQSVMAIKVTDLRLKKRQNRLFSQPYEVILPTFNLEKLQSNKGKEFEIFMVEKYGGIPNLKGGKDYGIDGYTQYGTPIQVKKWRKPVGRDTLDAFLTAIERDDKSLFEKNRKEGQICGFIIGFEFSKDAINEAARLRNKENTIIELKYVRDIIPYDNPPQVSLTAEEMENLKCRFETQTESEAGIDFYAWDFNHKENTFHADVVMDKEGVQEKKFEEGEHQIAVKAIDKRGLDGEGTIKVKVEKKK